MKPTTIVVSVYNQKGDAEEFAVYNQSLQKIADVIDKYIEEIDTKYLVVRYYPKNFDPNEKKS